MTERARHRWLARAERLGRRLEDLLLTAFLSGLIVLATLQILLRNAFSAGMPWADGIIRLAVLWLALLGAIAASREHKHIAIDVLSRLLPQAARRYAAIVTNLFTATVAGLLAWYSWAFVSDSRAYGDVLLNNWPAWPLQLILPIGFGLIAYRYVVRTTGLLINGP